MCVLEIPSTNNRRAYPLDLSAKGSLDTSDKLGREKPNPNHVEEELGGRRVVPAFLGAMADFIEKVLVSKWMRLVVVRLSARGTRRGDGVERASMA